MTTIKLEIPSSDEIAMFHMGEALRNMAVDYGYVVPSKCNITHTETVGDVSRSVKVENKGLEISDIVAAVKASLDEAVELGLIGEPESIDIVRQQASDAIVEVSDTIDVDGLPWDQRIHSRGKTRLADNTWRMARKPNDKSDEEWTEYVEGVKTELKALMAIPVATGAELDVLANIPVITAEQRAELKVHVDYAEDPNEVDPFAVDVGPFYWEHPESCSFGILQTREQLNDYLMSDGCCVEITKEMYDKLLSESKDVVIPPPLVTPPVVDAVVTPPVVDAVVTPPVVDAVVTPPVVDAVVTPPVVDAVVTPPPADFGALMRFITANKAKLTSPAVDDVLAGQGLASLALLATRPELIPQFHAALVKLL